MADYHYTSQNVYVVRDEEQGIYKFGLVLDGAFVVFASRKLGGVDADIQAAKLAKQQEQEQAAAQNATASTSSATVTSAPEGAIVTPPPAAPVPAEGEPTAPPSSDQPPGTS